MEINPNQLGISAFNRTTSELRVIVYTAAIQERDSLEKRVIMDVDKGKSFPEGRAGLGKLVPLFLIILSMCVNQEERRLVIEASLVIFHFVLAEGEIRLHLMRVYATRNPCLSALRCEALPGSAQIIAMSHPFSAA